MKSLILTYFILGVLVNAVVWWATDISAQEEWRLDQLPQTGNEDSTLSGSGASSERYDRELSHEPTIRPHRMHDVQRNGGDG